MKKFFLTFFFVLTCTLPSISHAFFVNFFIENDNRNIAATIDHALADIAYSSIPDFIEKFPPSYPYGNHLLLSNAHYSFITISRSWPSFIHNYYPSLMVQDQLHVLLESLTDLDIALNRFHVNLRLNPNVYIDLLNTINDILEDIIHLMLDHPTHNTILMLVDGFDAITDELYSAA